MCEGHNYNEAQCLGVGGGCCDFEDGRCWWGGSVCVKVRVSKGGRENGD